MFTLKRILVPLDGSELSEQALPMACSLARQYNGRLILLRAAGPHPSVKYVSNPNALDLLAKLTEQLQVEAEHYLVDRQHELRRRGYEVDILLAKEPPAEAILAAALARDVDLIVMATHGWGGPAPWDTGSVADRVARHSPCPVLLIRQHQPRRPTVPGK